jgi:hypothetical protein
MAFALPLWVEFWLEFQCSNAGHVSEMKFVRRDALAVPPSVAAIRRWMLTFDDVASWPDVSKGDDWFPMKTCSVRVQVEAGSSTQYLLEFRFGLLQSASVIL